MPNGNTIPNKASQEVTTDNFNVGSYLKNKNSNIKSVKEATKPTIRGTSEKLDFKQRDYNKLSQGQKQTVMNRKIENNDGLSEEETYNKMLVDQSPNYVNKVVSKIPLVGQRAAGLLSKVGGKQTKNDKKLDDFDADQLYMLYKAAKDKSPTKEAGYKNIYGKTGEDYLKGSSKNLLNPSVTADMGGSAGRVSSKRNSKGELVITDQYDFSKVGEGYKKQGLYGKIRYALGQNGEEAETGKTFVTVPKKVEEDLKRREASGSIDNLDAYFQKTTSKLESIPQAIQDKGKEILKDKRVQQLVKKVKTLAT